jgi:hypothetical protein
MSHLDLSGEPEGNRRFSFSASPGKNALGNAGMKDDMAAAERVRTAGPGAVAKPRRSRWIAAGAALAVAVVAFVLLRRSASDGPPGWSPIVPVPGVAAEIESTTQRLLAAEASAVTAAAQRAGRVPGLAALLASSLDGAAFQDALASEPWWKDFRSYGCAVFVGDEVKGVWQLPGTGLTPVALARAIGGDPAGSAPARLVAGPSGFALGAAAPIANVKDARVLLVEGVDRQKVAALAARANVVMMLSDGKQDLGASLPDSAVSLVEPLVGRESSHVLVERHLRQLAVAVPWTTGLWLWVATGWEP